MLKVLSYGFVYIKSILVSLLYFDISLYDKILAIYKDQCTRSQYLSQRREAKDSGKSAHMRSLARVFAAQIYKLRM